ncbi:TetR family transcriptional regulator [Conexibacter stalactiti]|uniref:TetR family transcriptional regulator n=1 Tax=Conexibacter stalactiti TaxID=1940611 RepID=A0ABU4HL59_9ACTN|nr:TetR family transcriptional regulator [Conexibacter stalactiti]MDW5592729.1 TetR family transcriptional regulator [Conexibacter stalactiti]MEC5033370.1 TetR family transcriptional regulator [Conexibacter stalactiti]
MNKGRRRGSPDTRDAVLQAARAQFAQHGYSGTTLRGVAAEAGVDVALVSYFFGRKAQLFAAALALPVSPADAIDGVLAEGLDGLGERLLRRLLAVWDDPVSGGPLLSVLRSAPSHEESAALLREFVEQELIARLARAIDAPPAQARLRAAAVASQVLGLVFSRYVLRIEPLASADHDALVALIGPVLEGHLSVAR